MIFCSLLIAMHADAQIGRPGNLPRPNPNTGGASQRGVNNSARSNNDTLKHRTGLEDSITIYYRYLDSSRLVQFDSSIYDFRKRLPVPATVYNLGNLGAAANNYLFDPFLKAGWDAGFHVLDVYKFKLEDTRFYNTTRPYSEIGYLLGSKSEQMINLLHSQNVKPNWNLAFQYRLINSPGFVQNLNTNHNNYRFNSWYQSTNKRYSNFFVVVANTLQTGENGGLKNDLKYLDNVDFKERFSIPVKLGPDQTQERNPFTNKLITGNKYKEATIFLRQQYDIGQKDSLIVNDTTVIPLFYPRLRIEHNFKYGKYTYRFQDINSRPDTLYYKTYYHLDTANPFFHQDQWREIMNDISFYTFPDRKNPQQFLKLGATIQNLSANFDSSNSTGVRHNNFYNFFGHAEYRNQSRNKLWDIEAYGNLYFLGLNSGDYDAYISLKRLLSKKIGSLELGFRNVNRTPSYVFNSNSSFWREPTTASFNKENYTVLFASIEQPKLRLRLQGKYFLVNKFTYFSDYNKRSQESGIFNVLQIGAEKESRIGKRWMWRAWLTLQQKAGSSPIQIPLIFTRHIFAYEGNLGFKNLNTVFGLEMRYHTNFKNPGYSPLMGQFFYQDTLTITRNLPELDAFVHFRIRTFTAYVRMENLNTLRFSGENSGFTNNNLVAPDYPTPGMVVRFGIFWSFIN